MKKQYIRYGTVICILVLLAFLTAFVIYTGNKIKEYNSNFTFPLVTGVVDYHDENVDGHLEKMVASSWKYFEENKEDFTGFYSMITDVRSGQIIFAYGEYAGSDVNAEIEKLNNEAQKICDEAEQSYNGPSSATPQKGVFTSSYSVVCVSGNGNLHVVYGIVGKPLKNVFKTNAVTYILLLAGFIIFEAAVAVSFVMLYKNQMNYEIRNQKLTRGIAHELKTPLAVTKATVENWDYFDDDRRKDYSKRVINEVDHMSDMVGKLIDVSKIKEGSDKINYEAVDLKKLTEDIIARNGELIRERIITVAFNHDDRPYTVLADPDMMNMVISNFMSNAIKYCDHIIKIQLNRSGRKIEFGITNDGAKIEKKDLDKIWDVFYTTDKARTDRMSSSGVGLSVVKSILDVHKADYGCTSDDKGTEFKFSMPAYEKA